MSSSSADVAQPLLPLERSGVAGRPARFAIILAFAAVYLIWGSTYLAIKIAVETLPPLLMAGTRFVTAGVLLYAFLRLRGAEPPSAAQWRTSAIAGGLLLLGGNGLVVWAQQSVDSSVAALLVATMPLWIVVLNTFWPGGSRPTLREIAGIVLGLIGLFVLVFPDVLRGWFAAMSGVALEDAASQTATASRSVDPWGATALVLASLSWAIGSLYSRRAPLPKNLFVATAMQMICGGTLQLLVGFLLGEGGRINFAGFSRESLLAFGYLIVFGSWIGFSAYVWLLRVVPPAKVATYAYVNPVVAVLLAWAIVGEPLTPWKLVAMALIVPAVVLITTQTRPRTERVGTGDAR